MKKEVLLSITGLQMSPDSDSDTTELFAPGEYYYRNDKHYLLYDEVLEGYDTPTRNVIKVAPDYMELTRKGTLNVHMVFEKNKKNVTYYYTPYGSLLIGIDAQRVEVEETENLIRVEVEYALEVNYEHIAQCHIHIEVQPQGNPAFRII
jgi:uncharacterized beta-barrel protein YwiB (DUF1934 family)